MCAPRFSRRISGDGFPLEPVGSALKQGLTAGDSQADNVQQAAIRLDGANELLDGYVSLGLPQAWPATTVSRA
jgi:hypothetical protein